MNTLLQRYNYPCASIAINNYLSTFDRMDFNDYIFNLGCFPSLSYCRHGFGHETRVCELVGGNQIEVAWGLMTHRSNPGRDGEPKAKMHYA